MLADEAELIGLAVVVRVGRIVVFRILGIDDAAVLVPESEGDEDDVGDGVVPEIIKEICRLHVLQILRSVVVEHAEIPVILLLGDVVDFRFRDRKRLARVRPAEPDAELGDVRLPLEGAVAVAFYPVLLTVEGGGLHVGGVVPVLVRKDKAEARDVVAVLPQHDGVE